VAVLRLLGVERQRVHAAGAAEPADVDGERGVAARGEVAVHRLDVEAPAAAVLVVGEVVDDRRPGAVAGRAVEIRGEARAVRQGDHQVPLDDDRGLRRGHR
jgi:hypothetical protein